MPRARPTQHALRAALATLAAVAAVAASCDRTPDPLEIHLGEVADAAGEGSVALDVDLRRGPREVTIFLDGTARVVEVALDAPAPGRSGASLEAPLSATLDGALPDEGDGGAGVPGGAWFRPRPSAPGATQLVLLASGDGTTRLTVWARGAPPPATRRERSLVWTDPAIVDDPTIVGLGRVLAAASDDGHGGLLLDAWFRRFATTAHSERAGPAQLAVDLAATEGPDPATWDLDALPFMVTAVHNRLDLAPRDAPNGCGQLRVSLASLHPIYAPLHLIFLFRQAPAADDWAPDGTLHCLGTARRWARLSALDGDDFTAAARALLDAGLVHDAFLLAESVELTVSPWEWRQWLPLANPDAMTVALLPTILDNPPLFQTVDVDSLNTPGALRDDFLAFVADNAAALDARMLIIPDRFRAPSARVPPGAPRTLLDLAGLDPAVATAFPDLRDRIEIVGCPACHTTGADFIHTTTERLFSPFYDAELDARALRLDLLAAGLDVALPPFGPLQTTP